MSLEAIAFFRKAALGYIRGDIQELIGSQLTCAGPLLSITVNGIDLMGGICFSFTKGSRERSIEYMTTHMKLNRDVATALYVGVRCGIAHQGMPKIGFNFFLLSHRHEPRTIVYKSDGRYLWLNVTELAYCFLDSLSALEKDPQSYVRYYPSLDPNDLATYRNAVSAITLDIQDLCTRIGEEKHSEEEARFERGEISEIASSSAYFPNNTLNVSLKVDPEEER